MIRLCFTICKREAATFFEMSVTTHPTNKHDVTSQTTRTFNESVRKTVFRTLNVSGTKLYTDNLISIEIGRKM
jgi:hypothetical protein